MTAERAEAAAGRNQLERAIRDLSERRARLERQVSEASRELSDISDRIAALPDPDEKREMVEIAEQAVADAEGAAMEAEAALAEARRTESHLRQPLEAARARSTGWRPKPAPSPASWPRRRQAIFRRRRRALCRSRFETALGAALGDDLDSALDPAAPAHWHGNGDGAGDPSLPSGAKPLIAHVRAPAALTRALRQIGVVEKQTL